MSNINDKDHWRRRIVLVGISSARYNSPRGPDNKLSSFLWRPICAVNAGSLKTRREGGGGGGGVFVSSGSGLSYSQQSQSSVSTLPSAAQDITTSG